MNLTKVIKARDLFLIINDTIVISDIHAGYEESLHKQGYFIPKGNISELKLRLAKVLHENKISRIIINGDLLHSFSRISARERHAMRELIDFLRKKAEVFVIRGNHDKVIDYVLTGIKPEKEIVLGDILITHGDVISGNSLKKNIKTIIIGHEHPSIEITSGPRSERYKCFLVGKYKRKDLIVMPSCNMLLEGTDILRENLLSPYLSNINNFGVFVVEDRIYDFGKVKELKKKFRKDRD